MAVTGAIRTAPHPQGRSVKRRTGKGRVIWIALQRGPKVAGGNYFALKPVAAKLDEAKPLSTTSANQGGREGCGQTGYPELHPLPAKTGSGHMSRT
jgi:hypothetical protein